MAEQKGSVVDLSSSLFLLNRTTASSWMFGLEILFIIQTKREKGLKYYWPKLTKVAKKATKLRE